MGTMTVENKEEVPEKEQATGEPNQPEEQISKEELQEVAEVEIIEPDDDDLDPSGELELELAEALRKKEEYLDGWQRTQADFANYKKRVERDRQQVQQNATANVVRRYLEILDDIERALANQPQDGDGAVWADGIDLVYRKWLNALEADDVKPMEVGDQHFDPTLHEGISQEESDEHESGEIIEVVQTGYFIGDRVLRPAKVRVAQ